MRAGMQTRNISVQLQCAECGSTFSIKREMLLDAAGKELACPHCGYVRRVPLKASGPVPARKPAIDVAELTAPAMIDCPDCQSENCQRVEIAHVSGTSHSSSSGIGTAVIFNAHAMAEAVSLTTTTGRHQTRLAALLAPPDPETITFNGLFIAIFCCFIPAAMGFAMAAFFMFESLSSTAANEPSLVVLEILLAIAGIAAVCFGIFLIKGEHKRNRSADRFNNERYPRLLDIWKRQFICLKFGCIWIPTHLRHKYERNI